MIIVLTALIVVDIKKIYSQKLNWFYKYYLYISRRIPPLKGYSTIAVRLL